jgi:HK97 family phage prohead protease
VERKRFNIKFKSVGDEGSFTGICASYNTVDHGGDLILPSAFQRTLAAGKNFPLLYQHQSDNPIGTAKVTDSPQGLQVEGRLLLDLDDAKKAHVLLRAGVLKGLSIGYDTLQSKMDGDVRVLTEIRLWEISVVTFPMNENATISSVKSLSLSDDEVQHHLQAIRRHQKGMRYHIKCLLGDDLDDDAADDPALLEGDGSEQDVESKALLVELQKLVAQAGELASA